MKITPEMTMVMTVDDHAADIIRTAKQLIIDRALDLTEQRHDDDAGTQAVWATMVGSRLLTIADALATGRLTIAPAAAPEPDPADPQRVISYAFVDINDPDYFDVVAEWKSQDDLVIRFETDGAYGFSNEADSRLQADRDTYAKTGFVPVGSELYALALTELGTHRLGDPGYRFIYEDTDGLHTFPTRDELTDWMRDNDIQAAAVDAAAE